MEIPRSRFKGTTQLIYPVHNTEELVPTHSYDELKVLPAMVKVKLRAFNDSYVLVFKKGMSRILVLGSHLCECKTRPTFMRI